MHQTSEEQRVPKSKLVLFSPKSTKPLLCPRSFPKCVCNQWIASIYDSHLLVTLAQKIKRSIYRQGLKNTPNIFFLPPSPLLDPVDIVGCVSTLLTHILYIQIDR